MKNMADKEKKTIFEKTRKFVSDTAGKVKHALDGVTEKTAQFLKLQKDVSEEVKEVAEEVKETVVEVKPVYSALKTNNAHTVAKVKEQQTETKAVVSSVIEEVVEDVKETTQKFRLFRKNSKDGE